MKVNEFVNLYNKNNTIDIKKTLNVIDYVPILYKREMVKLVLDGCTKQDNGRIKINSLDRYLLFTITVISLHTNLEFNINKEEENNLNNVINDYDLLCKNNLINKIIECFETDYNICQDILNMETDDLLQNNVAFIDTVSDFIKEISKISDGLSLEILNELKENDEVKNALLKLFK